MAVVDIIKWNANARDFCYKYPTSDIRLGSQLVVYPAQTAFFVNGGAICDEFDKPGTYTIKSENIPVLNKVINVPFGGSSPFSAEVWFVNQITKLNLKWGTQTPIQLEDPTYNIFVPIRAYGQYGLKISQPRMFLESLIGSMESFNDASIEEYFRGRLLMCLCSIISKVIAFDRISIFTINAYLTDISIACAKEIDKFFEQYGVKIVDFSIISINIPQDDEGYQRLKAIKAATAGTYVGGRDIYQMERSFDVLDKAAGNNGTAAGFIGMGFGAGIGHRGIGVAEQIDPNPEPAPPPIPKSKTYYLYVNGNMIGGNTLCKIQELFDSGQINGETLVWRSGMNTWKPMSSVKEIWDTLETPSELS